MKVIQILIVLLCFSAKAISQNINMILNINTSDYALTTTDQWSLTIINGSSANFTCYLKATVNVEGEGLIGQGNSKSFVLPGMNSIIFNKNSTELFDSNAVNYDNFYRDAVVLTGQLPSRNYTVCVELINLNNFQVLNKTCIDFRLQKFQPPINIYPFDKDTVEQNALNFQWLPPQPLESGMRYTIKIAEVLSIQTKVSALFSNNLYYSESNIPSTIYQYPVSARRLIPGRTYTWIVEARLNNLILNSEPTTFIVKGENTEQTPGKLRSSVKYLSYSTLKKHQVVNLKFSGDKINIIVESDYALNSVPMYFHDENNLPVHAALIDLKEGRNFISLDISGNKNLQNIRSFLLIIHATKNDIYRLHVHNINFKSKERLGSVKTKKDNTLKSKDKKRDFLNGNSKGNPTKGGKDNSQGNNLQFCKTIEADLNKILGPLASEPNDAATWRKARTMVEDYLTPLWRKGDLPGARPDEAFFIRVGLGESMTSNDILEGRMIVQIGIAEIRPSEFNCTFNINLKMNNR